MAKKVVRVGSRESSLAMSQSKWVINEIKKKYPDLEFELISFKTTGDKILDKRLDKIGGKGLFTKELETALLDNQIDIAVHSMKDMPSFIPDGLKISAVSKREDPRDVLISVDNIPLSDLKNNCVIGTSSLRRELQIKELRNDIMIKTLRGNVETRIKKLENKEYDAIILAMAGLKRLGLTDKVTYVFKTNEIIPAAGQGALGIETRVDYDIEYLLESINDENTSLAVIAERAFMKKLNGSCSTPIGAYAEIVRDVIKIQAFYGLEDKSKTYREYIEGNRNNAVALGEELADRITLKIVENQEDNFCGL